MDGTLINSLAGIAHAMNQVLQKSGFPTHREEAYREFIGAGIDVLVTRALPQADRCTSVINESVVEMRRIYASTWPKTGGLFPGIATMLDKLVARSLERAILSNKPHDFTLQFAEHYLDRWDFCPIYGMEADRPKKPDPAAGLQIANELKLRPDQIIFVGDSGIDMETALRAGMHPVGVSWGYRSASELKSSGASYIINQPEELLVTIDKIK